MSEKFDLTNSDPEFSEPIRNAQNLIQEREMLTPEQIMDRSDQLLISRFGASENRIARGYSIGAVGLQADHSHYYNGFALMKPMRLCSAVSIRASDLPVVRIVMEGDEAVHEFGLDGDLANTPTASLRTILAQLATVENRNGLDVAVVATVPIGLESSYLASIAVALSNAAESHSAESHSAESFDLDVDSLNPDGTIASRDTVEDDNNRVTAIKQAIERALGYSFSSAYIIASRVTDPADFILVDTDTLEHLPVQTPDKAAPDWALVDTATFKRSPDRNVRIQLYNDIVSRLRQKRFPDLTSLRYLEHKDLEVAMGLLPRRLRAALRFLVMENRRVQRLVAAIRNQDWQLLGALLIMSHASRRDDWMDTTALHDFVVDSAERFSLEGVYGAARTGEGPFVLVAGQPYQLPAFLDHLRSNWPGQATGGPESLIL